MQLYRRQYGKREYATKPAYVHRAVRRIIDFEFVTFYYKPHKPEGGLLVVGGPHFGERLVYYKAV